MSDRVIIFKCDECKVGVVALSDDPTLEGRGCAAENCDGTLHQENREEFSGIEKDRFVIIIDDISERI